MDIFLGGCLFLFLAPFTEKDMEDQDTVSHSEWKIVSQVTGKAFCQLQSSGAGSVLFLNTRPFTVVLSLIGLTKMSTVCYCKVEWHLSHKGRGAKDVLEKFLISLWKTGKIKSLCGRMRSNAWILKQAGKPGMWGLPPGSTWPSA